MVKIVVCVPCFKSVIMFIRIFSHNPDCLLTLSKCFGLHKHNHKSMSYALVARSGYFRVEVKCVFMTLLVCSFKNVSSLY